MSVASAKTAIAYLCRILRNLHVPVVAPDEFRQAKFNGPVGEPLLEALHSLVLLKLCGSFDSDHCARASQFLRDLRKHEYASGHLPREAVLMTKLYLLQWGCPANLAAHLHSACGSRLLLLLLGWLVDHCALFEQWYLKLGREPDLQALLPPLVHDTSRLPGTSQAFSAAVSDSQQRQSHAEALLSQMPPEAATNASIQHALSLLGKVEKQHKDTTCLVEAHLKNTHHIIQLQQPQQHPHAAQPGGRRPPSQPSPPAPVPGALNLFDLHLLANPDHLQQHHQAVLAALATTKAQQECRLQASTFRQWMLSVLHEHLSCAASKQRSPQLQAARRHVDARLLSAPVSALEQEAQRLWQQLEQRAATAPPRRPSKPSSNLSMYSRPASASSRPSPKQQQQQQPVAPLSLEDFTPAHYHSSPDATATAAFVQLPADLLQQAAAQLLSETAVHTEAVVGSAPYGVGSMPGGDGHAMLQQPLQEPRIASVPVLVIAGSRQEGGEVGRTDPAGVLPAAAMGAQVMAAAKELARSRAAVKRQLLAALAPVARAEQLVVLGV